jgi:S-adenosylhomocysteine hydrolase
LLRWRQRWAGAWRLPSRALSRSHRCRRSHRWTGWPGKSASSVRCGPAAIALSASNPLSTQDDVCAALAADGIAIYAEHGEDLVQYRQHLERTLPSGRALYLLAEGRLVGQVAAEASPAAVMDLGFADQALSTRYLFETTTLTPGLYDVPPAIDARVAALKLEALGLRLDRLTDAQRAYAGSWQLGTS